jgi:hypothetical protein
MKRFHYFKQIFRTTSLDCGQCIVMLHVILHIGVFGPGITGLSVETVNAERILFTMQSDATSLSQLHFKKSI